VPMEQMTRDIRHPFNPERFPEGYQRDFDTLTLNTKARKRFEELLPEGQVFIHYEPLQENSYEFTWERFQDPEKRPAEGPKELDRTWSKDHQWSLFYMDEGPPLPEAPHTSYFWNTDMSSFVDHYRDAAPSPDLLNAAKLDRLMQRYRLQLKDLPMLKEGRPANRLNFAALERRDVLQGLVDFAALGPAHATELAETYNALDAKPFGDTLDIGALEAELARTIANTSGQQGE